MWTPWRAIQQHTPKCSPLETSATHSRIPTDVCAKCWWGSHNAESTKPHVTTASHDSGPCAIYPNWLAMPLSCLLSGVLAKAMCSFSTNSSCCHVSALYFQCALVTLPSLPQGLRRRQWVCFPLVLDPWGLLGLRTWYPKYSIWLCCLLGLEIGRLQKQSLSGFFHPPALDPLCSLKQVMELELLSLPASHGPSRTP